MDRSLRIAFTVLIALFLLIARPGCNLDLPDSVSFDNLKGYYDKADELVRGNGAGNGINNQSVGQISHSNQSNANISLAPSSILIGSFNIEAFGKSKASKPHVMEKLVDIARRFDLLAIQEIRNKDQSVVPAFMQAVNSDGSRFAYYVGPRQGYSVSKEQYVVMYDSQKFRMTSEPYIAPDPRQALHRSPMVTSFECTQAPMGQGFTFTLLNIHTDPDVVPQEFQALQDIMPAVKARHPNEDDFIIVGDFNGTADRIGKYRWLQNQLPLIRTNWVTNVSGRSIDNIVINGRNTAEFQNQSGVLDVVEQYGLTPRQADEVSDHFPVWAVFSTVEAINRTADAAPFNGR